MKIRFVILLVFAFCALLVFDLGSDSFRFLNRPLEKVDAKNYAVCKNFVDNPMVTNKDIQFYVSFNPLLWLWDSVSTGSVNRKSYLAGFKEIRFGPMAMQQEYFEAMAAHLIGRIERCCDVMYEADIFALKILGDQKRNYFIRSLKAKGDSKSYIDNLLRAFDAKYGQEKNSRLITGGIETSIMSRKGPIFLREFNPLAYQACLEIIKRASFSVELEIEFYVEPDLKQMAVTVVNKVGPSWIYFHPLALVFARQDFEALVAHELGHIDCRCGDEKTENQIQADQFAVRVVGKNPLRDFLLKYGLSPNDPRLLALR